MHSADSAKAQKNIRSYAHPSQYALKLEIKFDNQMKVTNFSEGDFLKPHIERISSHTEASLHGCKVIEIE